MSGPSYVNGGFSDAMLRARIVSTLDETGLSSQHWNDLVAEGSTNTVFQTHQWMRSWVTAFGHQYEPLLVAVSDGSKVTAVGTFVLDRRRRFQTTLRFAGQGRADYCDILTGSRSRENLAAIVDALSRIDSWDIAKLSNIPSDSPTVTELPALCRQLGWHVSVRNQFPCPTLVVRGREEQARRIQRKASLRRPVNHFSRVGRLSYRDLRTHEEIEPFLERLFSQHVERRKMSGHDSLFSEPSNRRLYHSLVQNLSGTGWLLFSVVVLDDEPVACHFGFDYNDVVTWYKPSFDVAHAPRSPGLLMVKHLIDYTVANGRRELDFTIGDEPFKRRFTNAMRHTSEVTISRSRLRLEANRLWRFSRHTRNNLLWP